VAGEQNLQKELLNSGIALQSELLNLNMKWDE
jgi:hypothetical protein